MNAHLSPELNGRRQSPSGNLPEQVISLMQQACFPTDISEHLLTIYSEAVECRPKLIVELGVRSGESTKALLLAAERYGSRVLSIDVEDCSKISSSNCWMFIQSDDILFGSIFSKWAPSRGLVPAIDVLFIDTSHSYEHTLAEIHTWFPYLTPGAKVMFHDTGNSALYGFGVTRAIGEYLQIQFNEQEYLPALSIDGWLIRHNPACNGLTVLRKLEA
jgi:cephalosporin hydroxylase